MLTFNGARRVNTQMKERRSVSFKAKVVAWTQGQSYLWEFLPVLLLAIRGGHRTLEDLKAMIFMFLAPIYFIVGFRGVLNCPFGVAKVGSRNEMKSVTYGVFKTYFCYLRDLKKIPNAKSFFPVVVDV